MCGRGAFTTTVSSWKRTWLPQPVRSALRYTTWWEATMRLFAGDWKTGIFGCAVPILATGEEPCQSIWIGIDVDQRTEIDGLIGIRLSGRGLSTHNSVSDIRGCGAADFLGFRFMETHLMTPSRRCCRGKTVYARKNHASC